MKSQQAPGDNADAKRINKIRILNMIRENRAISRAKIAKRTGLSAPTVTRIVDSLIRREKLVVDIGVDSADRGRPPNLVRFSGESGYVIGIDLGFNNIHAVLANLNAQILSEIKFPTQMRSGPDPVLARTGRVILQLIEHSGVDQSRILGVGVAVGGLVNRDRGILEYNPDYGWEDVDIPAALHKFISLPVKFDNVTRAMALGELWYGIGRKFRNFICVNVGHGIGGGIVVDGKPLYGARGMSGEFGHMTVDPTSRVRCECGNYGCLEILASGNGLARTAREGLERGVSTHLHRLCEGDASQVTAEMVARAAKAGDEFARQIFLRAAEYLGIGLAGLVNLFNPEAIAIGGGVSQAGDLLLEPVRAVVQTRAMQRLAHDLQVVPVTFGMKSAAMGAIGLILNEVLNLRIRVGSSFQTV